MPPNSMFRGICKFLVAALSIGLEKKNMYDGSRFMNKRYIICYFGTLEIDAAKIRIN